MKVFGSLFVNPENPEQPLVYIPADGTTSELYRIDEMPEAAATALFEQGTALNLTPLALIADLESGK
jgi:hypothetical protein